MTNVILPTAPDWGGGVTERWSYSTEILTSRAGREQRISLRVQPRRQVEFRARLTGADLIAFRGWALNHAHETAYLPDPAGSLKMLASAPAGSTSVSVEGASGRVLAGGYVCLGAGMTAEVLPVTSVAGTAVTLGEATAHAHETWEYARPALRGFARLPLSVSMATNTVGAGKIVFDGEPGGNPVPTPAAPVSTLDGRELFLLRPNFANAVEQSWVHDVQEVDFGRGIVTRIRPVPFGWATHKGTYLRTDRAAVEQIRDFFLRMRGRQGEFFMPSWTPDFEIAAPVASGSVTFSAKGASVAELYGASRTHRAAFVKLLDGTVICRKVVSLTAGAGVSTFTIDSAFGVSFTPAQVVLAGFVTLNRLASDDLVIEWVTDQVANVTLNFTGLEYLPEETV